MSRPVYGGAGSRPDAVAPAGAQAARSPAGDDDGVDRTLIREFLRLSPSERLDVVDGYAQEIEALRKGVRRSPAEP